MRFVLAVLVLCGCGGATPVAVENRGGAARASCDLPERIEFEARRYGNLDANDKDYQVWSSWRVGLQLHLRSLATGEPTRRESTNPTRRVGGTIAMVGDDLTWTFDLAGSLDIDRCLIELRADTHEPINIAVDVTKRTGTIRSIDDEWLLGPPFPPARP